MNAPPDPLSVVADIRVRHGQSFPGLGEPDSLPEAPRIEWLVRPGLRQNPRRAHLLVSTVLGKHVPTDPVVVRDAGYRLADRVVEVLGDSPAVVVGFAETATGLGHCVARRMRARCCVHSTRRAVAGITALTGFAEGHSHATSHELLPLPAEILTESVPVVLVDDEFSTGTTVLAAIQALHQVTARPQYVVASLVDMREEPDRRRMADLAESLGVRIDAVCLATGQTVLADDVPQRVAQLPACRLNPTAPLLGSVSELRLSWPDGVPQGGRHGFLRSDTERFDAAVAAAAEQLRNTLNRKFPGRPVLVVGHEESMFLPLRLALALAATGVTTRYQTTTRSPAYVVDDPGYPLRRGFRFAAPEAGESAWRYLYNAEYQTLSGGDPVLVVVVDGPANTPELVGRGGLVAALTAAGHTVLLATLPVENIVALRDTRTPRPLRGPLFGSYPPDEVSWLLTDLSHADLEAATALRERQIQAGTAHYAESLPIEYQPDAAYRELFDKVLAEGASRLALATATVAELVVAQRGEDIVLASLARAGTPIGVLVRRWLRSRPAEFGRPLDIPHYSLSIVRDRGIDTAALRYLARQYDPARVVFVDGWTGKGAIARELSAALREFECETGIRFSDDVAVLADPGHCVRTFGTREDFLIPTACLNSTVSGLVSRTVLNRQLLGPTQFHGAKFYRELSSSDVSNRLIDTVAAEFPTIAARVPARLADIRASNREPTWSGWHSVERIRAAYAIGSVNFVKPGVGETTRVLLRRLPWRILVRDPEAAQHAHIRLLARARGVSVEVVPDLEWACVGLIKELSE